MLELEFQFKPVFIFKITHNYFAGNQLVGYELLPSPESQQIIRKLGLMVSSNDNEVHFLYDACRAGGLLYYLENQKNLKFSFWLHAPTVFFYNFTNLPANHRNTILYFNNQKMKASGETNLHDKEYVAETNILHFKPAYFDYEIKKAKSKLAIQDDFGEIVWETELEKPGIVNINLSSLQEAKYKIVENNKEKESFVYLRNQMPPCPLALIEIVFSNQLKEEIIKHIKAEEDIPTSVYHISFDTRYTFWKYYIVPKYQNGLNSLSIQTGDKNISFSGPSKTKLPKGMEALSFESNKALALTQMAQYNFQLVNLKDAKGKEVNRILRRLPCPGIEAIKPESRDTSAKVFSEIIVYI